MEARYTAREYERAFVRVKKQKSGMSFTATEVIDELTRTKIGPDVPVIYDYGAPSGIEQNLLSLYRDLDKGNSRVLNIRPLYEHDKVMDWVLERIAYLQESADERARDDADVWDLKYWEHVMGEARRGV